MPEKHLYEYAVIRYVPRVEREEFVNVGLVMMCKRRRWARVELLVDPVKIGVFGGALTIDEIEHQLSAYKLIGEGHHGHRHRATAARRHRPGKTASHGSGQSPRGHQAPL